MKCCLAFVAINILVVCGQQESVQQTVNGWFSSNQEGSDKVAEKVDIIFTPDENNAVFLPLRDLPFLPTHSLFEPSRPTMIYVHGWLESGEMDLSTLAIRGAYLDRNDHNVITLDWSNYSKNINYHASVIPQLKVIAETVAEKIFEMVRNGYKIENLHLVGHSLGGQMVGKIGRHLKKLSSGDVVIPRIYALDPAGPGFEKHNIDGFEPISRTDGAYVQIIHTGGGFLGMKGRVGTIDFYPDGGSFHPGCKVDVTSSLFGSFQHACDHYRSWHFYQLTVRQPDAFPAIRCNSWDDFENDGTCYRDDIAYMGFGADIEATGKYFLDTNANIFNLSQGIGGITRKQVKVTRLLVPSVGTSYVDSKVPSEYNEHIFF